MSSHRQEEEMKPLTRFAPILSFGFCLSLPALAADSLVGEYEGKIKEVDGYAGQAGDACVVKIGTAADYGGSTTFGVNDVDTILFEDRHVDKLLDSERKVIKLITPGGPGKDVQIVIMKLGEDRAPTYLKMVRKKPVQHTHKFIDCDGLVKQ
jgi:hypothetical protein